MAEPAHPPTVRRRHVFFIAGFDPKSPRYYHALYRNQARRQAAVSGLNLQVDKERAEPSPVSTAWTVRASAADPAQATGDVHTTIELLQWDDIVRNHWAEGAWPVLRDGARTVFFGLRDGAVQRMYRLFRPPVYATLLPLVVLMLCAALAAGLGLLVAGLLQAGAGAPAPAAAVAGAALAVGLTVAAALAVHRIQFTWLLRLVRFTHLQSLGRVAGIDDRLQAFAERIVAVVAAARSGSPEAPDEVLVVGHSVGATLAMGVLSRGLQLDPRLGEQLSLLSLGHCLPLMTSLSPAQQQRDELQRVAQSGIPWLDVSAPIDWAAFPAVDPVAGAGLPPVAPGWHPKLVSPRFHQLFEPASYARLKANRFQVHLQYLMACERPGRYDYFGITAGPQTLQQRFAGDVE